MCYIVVCTILFFTLIIDQWSDWFPSNATQTASGVLQKALIQWTFLNLFFLNDDLEYLLNCFKCHPSRVWYVPLSLSGRLKSVSDSNNNGNNCPAAALITFPSSLPSQTGGQTTTAMVTDYNACLSHHSTDLQGKTHHKYPQCSFQTASNNKNVLLVPRCTLKHHARQAQAQAMVRDHIGLTTSVTTVTMAQSSPTKAFPCHSALVSHNVNGISLWHNILQSIAMSLNVK